MLKDFITLANLSFGFLALFLSIAGVVNYYAAFSLFALAVVCDYLDGKVARFSKPDDFGKELDSLADLGSFGVSVPLTVTFFYQGDLLLNAFGVVVFGCAAAIRLARFNLQKEKGVFFGLPVPAAALALLLIAPFANSYSFIAMVILGLLMVSRFELKKGFLF